MARVLFSLQVIVSLLVVPLVPGMPPQTQEVSLVLLGLILALPLAACGGIWGFSPLVQAFLDAFSHRNLGKSAPVSLKIWSFIRQAFPVTGGLAALTTLVMLFQGGPPGPPVPAAGLWALVWIFMGLTLSQILTKVVQSLSRPPGGTGPDLDPGFAQYYGLTAREAEVARKVLWGFTYKETAERLFISEATVKTHILRVYEKTGASSKMELSRFVQDFGGANPPKG